MVNLKSLHIDATSTCYSRDSIFALLATSPNLEVFSLWCLRTDTSGSQAGAVHLTKLHTLKLIGNRLEILLDRLTLPALERFEIRSLSEVCVNVHDMLQRSASPVTKFVFNVFKCSDIEEAPLLRLLDSLTLVEELILELWDENVASLIDRLTVPTDTAAGIARTHACPLLRSLKLKQENPAEYADAISKMLVSRSPPGSEPYLPASLEQRGSKRGTGVLRSLTLVHDLGYEDSAMCFPIGEEIAGLIQRGLEFAMRSRWGPIERGLLAKDTL